MLQLLRTSANLGGENDGPILWTQGLGVSAISLCLLAETSETFAKDKLLSVRCCQRLLEMYF